MAFETSMKIHFDEADPAGIAFSGGLFTKIHRCYEDFIAGIGEDPQQFFLKPDLIYPLRHFEGEYMAPLMPLQTYQVWIEVSKLSESSFSLQYTVGEKDKPRAQFRSTHVCVDKTTFKKSSIPEALRQKLEKFGSVQ